MARARAARKERALTEELASLLEKTFVPDLMERCRQPAVARALEEQYAAEKAAKRTAAGLTEWIEQLVEQVGAGWIRSAVFARLLEDRGLLGRRRIAGPGALDSQQQFFEIAPALTERDYLLTVFREIADHPGAEMLFGPRGNPAWRLSPSNDSVRALLTLLRETGDDGGLRFRFEGTDTRFLGDLYQDLSEGVRKRYALLQTPEFIEKFILERTLEPAIKEFGLDSVRLIDPTCGSGHFLLGAFRRLFAHRLRAKPGVDAREHAVRALAQIHGTDINPYAVAIAQFRLVLAYLDAAGIRRLAQTPRVDLNLAIADSLVHGGAGQLELAEAAEDGARWGRQIFVLGDEAAARRILGQRHHVVVGNPPYITCKDAALRELYRERYRQSASGKYALAAPFTERFFQLAEDGGFVGLINANSFMKREFGKGLIEKVLPHVELTQVVDTSGAFIPGHGTPTVILVGRNRRPTAPTVRAVMGKRGEPSTPEDPERGLVWSSIAAHDAEVGFENDYISVAEVARETFEKHPWSLGGGGAAELKELLEERADRKLGDIVDSIGISSFTLEDDVYLQPRGAFARARVEARFLRPMIIGEAIRDWSIADVPWALFPYDESFKPAATPDSFTLRFLWPYRTNLANNVLFGGKTKVVGGLKWFEYGRLTADKLRTPLSITYAEVATHNHFVLDRGGKVFKQTAPIIKLPAVASEEDHLGLLAYLNSSTACFWMKQVALVKANHTEERPERFEPGSLRYAFNASGLKPIPLPDAAVWPTLARFGRAFEAFLHEARAHEPVSVASRIIEDGADPASTVAAAEAADVQLTERMVGLQEDLDWFVYGAFGLCDRELGPAPGDTAERLPRERRPFLGGEPLAELSAAARARWSARAAAAVTPMLALIENHECKRRWVGAGRGSFALAARTFRERCEGALLARLLDNFERELAHAGRAMGVRELSATLGDGTRLARALEWLAGTEDTATWLAARILDDGVPMLAIFRFADAGLAKRAEWEKTWELQRREDQGEKVEIAVPPRYDQKDYASPTFWHLRGKLDVPKERFISYPGCEREDDRSPLIGWAGWDHLQRAQALAALFQERRDQDGWDAARLTSILAGLLELVPWLKQWHNEPDPAFEGQRMGDSYADFVSEKARELGLTLDDLCAWRPERKAGRRRPAPKAETDKAVDPSGEQQAGKDSVRAARTARRRDKG